MARVARRLSRREFIALTSALGIGGLLTACGDDAGDGTAATVTPTSTPLTSGPVPDPTGVIITRWREDPYALGSYSYLAKGAFPEDRDHLAAPVDDRVFFAGEATDDRYPATVHGAILSGRRAATEVTAAGVDTVAVIGAGAAGLAAAQVLADEGHAVTVVEARDRIGGRVHTDRSLGVPLDLGASWIHGVTDNPLTEIADDASIERARSDYDNEVVRDVDGRELEPSEIPASWVEVSLIEHEFAADVDDLSALALEEGAEIVGGDVVVPGGYDQLLEGLAGDYAVELSAPVTAIDFEGADTVVTVDAERRPFGAVVVTIPLGVLKAGAITFDPPLPETKAAAIEALGMGLLDKVYLRFDEVFWAADVDADLLGYVGPERGYFAEWLNLTKYTGEPILAGFNAAGAADEIERLDDGEIVDLAMATLRDMYGA